MRYCSPIYVLCVSSHFWPFTKANLILENFNKNLGFGQTPPLVGPKAQVFPKNNFDGTPYLHIWLPSADGSLDIIALTASKVFFSQFSVLGEKSIKPIVFCVNDMRLRFWKHKYSIWYNKGQHLSCESLVKISHHLQVLHQLNSWHTRAARPSSRQQHAWSYT